MSKVAKYLQKKGESLIVLKPIKVYIPKANFESDLSRIEDTYIITFGVFNFTSLDGKEKFNVKLPLRIRISFYKMESEGDFLVFTYDTNDVMIEKMVFIDNVNEASSFLNLFNSAKVKANTPEDLVGIFFDNMDLNKISTRVPSELVEAMISELVRWDKDSSVPFRMQYGKTGIKPGDFTPINIKDIPRVTSVFSAISFEDVKKALQAGVYMTRTNQKQSIGPIETVLYY